jgi:peptide/nickel transport system permease protein
MRAAVAGLRRLLRLVLSVAATFLGLTLVTFVIGRLIPIDPVLAVVGEHAAPSVYQAARARMGLDLPLSVQYLRYLRQLLHGDFGTSVITGQPVLTDLLHVFPATVELSLAALLIGLGLGIPLGVLAATRRGGWIDQAVRLLSLFGYSMPVFWLGLIGLLVFYARLGWVAGPGRLDVGFEDMVPERSGLLLLDSALAGQWEVMANAAAHLLLPAAILGLLSLAFIARMTRSFMLGQLSQEYVLAARAKGLSRRRVVWVHVLRNIAVPLITVIALTFGSLLEGAVLTETVFAWPGLGLYMKNSLFNADMNAVIGGTILIGVVYIGLNLLSDLLYPLLDPRADTGVRR